MKRSLIILILGLLCSPLFATTPIPLEDFFKDQVFNEIRLSPDGSKVSALSLWKGHMNLCVIDMQTKKPALLTALTTMGVTDVHWVGNKRLIFSGMEDGSPVGGLFAIDVDGKNSTALAKSAMQEKSQGSNQYRNTSYLAPYGDSETEILVVNNDRRLYDDDVYRMNIRTGSKKMVAFNPGKIVSWVADHKGAVRAGLGQDGLNLFLIYREGETGEFKTIKTWPTSKGKVITLDFDEHDELLYVLSGVDRDTLAVCLMDPKTGEIQKPLFEDPVYDADGPIQDRKGKLLGFSIERERSTTIWTDELWKKTQTMLDAELPGTQNMIASRSRDNQWVVVSAMNDRDPGTYYLLNTQKLTLEKLVSRRPWIKPEQLSECRPIVYTARDGLTIHGYLTLPQGYAAKNLPLIVNPHGGPWVRDTWGFNDEVQFLASRGYAVLQVNFRGSTGYGRKHEEAGYNQWGLAMQDDITDGVNWVVAQGYVNPARIAIYGASYGGYACMAGLAFTPDLYRCGINYVGVTDIALLQKTIPESWERQRADLENKTGKSKADRERMEQTSPMKNVEKIKVPVFFAYGEIDERVDMKHGTRMYSALKSRGIPVEWMSRPDEGHGYRRKENVYTLYGTMETFLAKYMGAGKTADVQVGKSEVIEKPAK